MLGCCFFGMRITWREIAFIVLLAAVYGYSAFRSLQAHMFKKMVREVFYRRLYFHGFKVSRYLETEAFQRLQNWLGYGMCYELAPVAMILLKGNKTARLCHGSYYDENDNFETHHAWVEFKIPLNGWWVADFAWISIGFCRKKKYLEKIRTSKGTLIEEFSCSHNRFFQYEIVRELEKAMLKSETSNVLLELGIFGNPINDIGFTKEVESQRTLRFSDGSFMYPHYRNLSKMPVSTEIIQDFAKRRARSKPTARTLRKTNAIMRRTALL